MFFILQLENISFLIFQVNKELEGTFDRVACLVLFFLSPKLKCQIYMSDRYVKDVGPICTTDIGPMAY